MNVLTLSVFTLFITLTGFSQTNTTSSEFNLDFETVEKGVLVGWNTFGDTGYKLIADSTTKRSGNYSASIVTAWCSAEIRVWK